jgi:hypothetical protein
MTYRLIFVVRIFNTVLNFIIIIFLFWFFIFFFIFFRLILFRLIFLLIIFRAQCLFWLFFFFLIFRALFWLFLLSIQFLLWLCRLFKIFIFIKFSSFFGMLLRFSLLPILFFFKSLLSLCCWFNFVLAVFLDHVLSWLRRRTLCWLSRWGLDLV